MIDRAKSAWISKTEKSTQDSWLDLFRQQVMADPEKLAVIYENRRVSYGELDRLSNWFAGKILKLSRKNDSFVGVSINRSPEMLAALIGVHKAGKAYLPLESSYPEKRLSYMVKDSQIHLLLTDDPERFTETDLFSSKIQIVDSKNCCEIEEREADANIIRSQRAYILYTSGSTGNPKGVVIEHESFLNFLMSMKEKPGCSSDDICLALTTISFDISGLELFLPLVCGAAICLVSSEAIYSPSKLVETINHHSVTLIQTTPSVWKLLIDSEGHLLRKAKLLSGGEPLTKEMANRLVATGCEVWNMYGPTETTIWSSIEKIQGTQSTSPSIGLPIRNTGLHILNEEMKPVERGETGQLWISGTGLAEGYWQDPGNTSDNFRILPQSSPLRMYSTGDYVFEDENGKLRFSGRKDNQLKIRGLRIETGEIEEALQSLEEIKEAVVLPRKDSLGNQILTCFYIPSDNMMEIKIKKIRNHLKEYLPDYVIPSIYIPMPHFPMTLNNKVDRNAFPDHQWDSVTEEAETADEIRRILILLWEKYLNRDIIDGNENFFDLGGHSLLVIQITQELSSILHREIQPMFFFENSTVNAQESALRIEEEDKRIDRDDVPKETEGDNEIDDYSLAIIGLSCEVPGASNPEEFWELLRKGETGIRDLSDEELLSTGLTSETINRKDYVKKTGSLDSCRFFDHSYFGYSPKEARFMDPQHRLMLEHSGKTFESAGIIPEEYDGKIGVFASCGQNQYLLKNIIDSPERKEWSDFQTMIGNENDFLASRVAYKYDLKGPALTVQTGCSSSLVSIQLAYQSLINYQCDMALCGGVSLNLPLNQGYIHDEGTIFSADGICRAFDKNATGTIFGSGIGTVLLKRLTDARKDKDPIIAVIRSAAVNNDGAEKIGYTAPGIKGQKTVIEEALHLADVSSDKVSYIEAHGTGTLLGDPIEITALSQAFGQKDRIAPCYIGSVKTNIGHLDAAAGIIGLIKTALSLKNRKIPPSLNYSEPNLEMKIDTTPFEVNRELREWKPINKRRIAGVSSFGIGGTNAHVVLESYNESYVEPESESRWLYHPLSAQSKKSLENLKLLCLSHLNKSDVTTKINTSFTLSEKRIKYKFGSFILSDLKSNSEIAGVGNIPLLANPETVFLFAGQAPLDFDTIESIMEEDSVFSKFVNHAFSILDSETGWDSFDLLKRNTQTTDVVQPLLFCIEWAMGQALLDYKVPCNYLAGHSLGEWVAATLAGALDIRTAIKVIIERGRIMSCSPKGQMLVVATSLEDLEKFKLDDLDIAAINSPSQIVLSGRSEFISKQQELLKSDSIPCKIINNRYAFHSRMMQEMSESFRNSLKEIKFNPLKIPVFSNHDGQLLEKGYTFSHEYWADHLLSPVNFNAMSDKMLKIKSPVFIESAPGSVLTNLLKSQLSSTSYAIAAFNRKSLISTVASIFTTGLSLSDSIFNKYNNARTVPAPTYTFDRHEHWIKPGKMNNSNCEVDISSYTQNVIGNKQNTTEKKLLRIWCIILGYEEIEESANFFELGGDSLNAVQLAKRINEEFHTDVLLRDFILNPDFRDMCQLIDSRKIIKPGKAASPFPIMFPAQVKGTKKPLFLVAGAHENRYYNCRTGSTSYEEDFLRYFSNLISFLGTDQPVYGFRPKGILFGEKQHKNIGEIADEFIFQLRTIQPEGPYIIGGECVGGSVAIEIASRLVDSGEEVSNLILMDTPCPGWVKCISEEIIVNIRRIRRRMKNHLKFPFSLNLIYWSLREIINLFNIYLIGSLFSGSRIRVKESSLFYQRKLLTYKVRKYPHKVDLIVNEKWNRKWKNMNWDNRVFTDLNVHVVPGDHVSRLSKYGHISGQIISEILMHES